MVEFLRKFPFQKIEAKTLEDAPWFRDLLLCWRPAGDALQSGVSETNARLSSGETSQEMHLRLAIRNNYLNFYRAGQSVAKVGFVNGRLTAKIHNKYVYGEKGEGQRYVTLAGSKLVDATKGTSKDYGGLFDLRAWMSVVNTDHSGKEKQFVDRVVGRNPNTIDLEMALPNVIAEKQRIAPRMDLVALEPDGDQWKIVFWEAKLADDPRVRRKGPGRPEVVDQLDQYSKWLGHADHAIAVASAYQNACRLLVDFHKLARSVNPGIESLGSGIVAAAMQDSGAPRCRFEAPPNRP